MQYSGMADLLVVLAILYVYPMFTFYDTLLPSDKDRVTIENIETLSLCLLILSYSFPMGRSSMAFLNLCSSPFLTYS